MAIGTNDLIDKFGTQDDVTNAANGAVAASAYSVAGDIDLWTNTDDAPEAAFVLHYTAASAPTAGRAVSLYATLHDIDGTNDESVPTASDESAHLLGNFYIPAATDSYISIRATLPNTYTSQVYRFFLKNGTDVSMTDTWGLKVTPVTVGPA